MFPPSAAERQATRGFCLQVQKKGLTGFPSCEDTDNTNATDCLDVPYREKIMQGSLRRLLAFMPLAGGSARAGFRFGPGVFVDRLPRPAL